MTGEKAGGPDQLSPEEAERLLASLDALTEDQLHALLPLWAGPDASTPSDRPRSDTHD